MDKPVNCAHLEKGWRLQNYSTALKDTPQLPSFLSFTFVCLLSAQGLSLFVP